MWIFWCVIVHSWNRNKMLFEFLMLCMAVALTDAGSYIATFPNTLIPGVNHDTRITILGASGPVNVVASLQYVQNKTEISSSAKQVIKGVPSTLSLKVPAGLPMSKYMISITGSGGLTFRNESKVNYEVNNLFLFLQTDKTRYSAGQEVKYRAILLHPNLLGYKGPLTITIFDGKDNKIDVIDHLTTNDGIVSGKLTLSREPVFGKWKIKINAVRKSLTKNFEVNDYVVPRFSVEITLQKGIRQTMSSFKLSVKARFTFNSDVLGNCTIQIYNKHYLTNFVEYWKQIRGEVNFTIPISDLRRNLSFYDAIIVRAMVTDNATALTIASEEDLKFISDSNSYSPQQTITITKTDKRETFVPGLTYHTPIFVGHDDEPVGTSGTINVIPTVTTAEIKQCLLNNPPTTWLDKQITVMQNFNFTFDESGYGALNVPVSVHTDKIQFELSYGSTQTFIELYSVSSQPVPLLRMNVKQIHVQVGDNITIATEVTEHINGLISYEIYARGILRQTFINRLVNAKRTYIDLKITGDLVPEMYVVATHLTGAGHILSDYIMLKVDGSPCKNKVSVTYNVTSLEPRQKLKMVIRADPNSTVYLMLEDEKNRLIGTDNDVFLDQIVEKVLSWNKNKKSQAGRKRMVKDVSFKRTLLNEFGRLTYINFKHGQKKLFKRNSMVSSEDIFHESGIVVLSDMDMYQKKDNDQLLMFNNVLPLKCIHITTLPPVTYPPGIFPTWVPGMVATPAPGYTYAPNRIPTPAAGQTYAPGRYPTWVPGMVPTPAPGQTFAPGFLTTTPAPASVAAKEIVRSRFPETWLWEEYRIGPSGLHTVIQAAPDAITSWVSSVFATNPDSGFGITDTKQKITVKKSFFMTMDLPSSMLLGEEVLVQITVFNYMSVSQQVFLQVVRSDDPANPIPAATMVQANQGHSTYVRVTPKSLGTLKINVHAKAGFFSASATDAIEKEVTVLPIGVHKTMNDQHLVDVSSGRQTFTKTIFLKDHPNMVPGTKHAYMQITGNFMVPSITGLQKLIQIPHGCGEQTMVNFAPDVFITKYMNITNQLTDEVKNSAISAIKSGYQHELGYRHYDGSFSIWGEKDSFGSTWLTAYVMKCFCKAKMLITIDSNILTTAMQWLLLQQNTDGSFRERKAVYYVDHRYTGTGIKLTAFTLISIMESRDIPNIQAYEVSSAITKGQRYLELRLSSVSDAYTLSIVCYALALSKSSYGPSCFSKLDNSKHIDGDYIYWQERTNIVRRRKITRSLQTRAAARDIETSAYALLTYMALGHHAKAFPIVKWLVAQRNPYGGFSSTQDTVVSIQALTEYAASHSSIAANYKVQFNSFGMNFMHSYTASHHNFDILHTVEIPSGLDNVIVQAMGDGIAVVDGVYTGLGKSTPGHVHDSVIANRISTRLVPRTRFISVNPFSQVVQSFYVSSMGNGSYISVSANIEKESLNSLTVKANIKWNGPTSSHMIMMEIEMPTGFVVDRDLFLHQTYVRKHETNGRKVALYLDEIAQNGQSVVRVKMDRSDPVVKNQACHITVYDYYEPTQQAVTIFESGLLKRANICDVCPLCSFCTGSSGFSQIGIGK